MNTIDMNSNPKLDNNLKHMLLTLSLDIPHG